jgi:N6-adenosine-specific RNA methylase IME4
MATTEDLTTQSVQGARTHVLSELTWESINEPGTYVERGTGNLYRFPTEALIPGASPSIVKESCSASVLLKISDDPFITTFKARLICAQNNVVPNF